MHIWTVLRSASKSKKGTTAKKRVVISRKLGPAESQPSGQEQKKTEKKKDMKKNTRKTKKANPRHRKRKEKINCGSTIGKRYNARQGTQARIMPTEGVRKRGECLLQAWKGKWGNGGRAHKQRQGDPNRMLAELKYCRIKGKGPGSNAKERVRESRESNWGTRPTAREERRHGQLKKKLGQHQNSPKKLRG